MPPESQQDLNEYIFAGADPQGDDALGADADYGDELPAAEPELEPEPEPAPEPEPEPEPDPEPEPEPEPKPKPADEPRIPKARFDEVNKRRKEAEARLRELEAQRQKDDPQAQAPEFDFEAAERAYMDAVVDGNTDKALALRREIRQAEQQHYAAQMRQAREEASQLSQAQIELKQTVAEAQRRYPQFDGASERYDEEATQEALELFEGYKARGYAPATAMDKAVRLTSRAYGFDRGEPPPEPEPPAPRTQPKVPSPQAVERKQRAAQAQPPIPQTEGAAPETGPDPMRMTEAEFDKLDPAEEARLRGDIL